MWSSHVQLYEAKVLFLNLDLCPNFEMRHVFMGIMWRFNKDFDGLWLVGIDSANIVQGWGPTSYVNMGCGPYLDIPAVSCAYST